VLPRGRRRAWRALFGSFVAVVAVIAVGCGDPPADATLDPSAGPVAPQVVCLGVPASKCSEFVKQATADAGTVPLVAIRIVCWVAPCFEQSGQVMIDTVYADGRRDSIGSGWGTVNAGGAPPPQPAATLPAGVEPTCVGLPAPECGLMASNVMTEVAPGSAIVSIVVTCAAVCDAAVGQGSTLVTYDDGSTTTHPWAYFS
jgi:hypothetical protein